MGASPFGYQVAEQFGIKVWPTRAGLVPFTLQPQEKERFSELSGVSLDADVSYRKTHFVKQFIYASR